MKQFTFVLFFVLTWASVGNSPAQQPADGKVPGFVVLPYMQWSTKNSMTILWETEELATSRVEYGEALLEEGTQSFTASIDRGIPPDA